MVAVYLILLAVAPAPALAALKTSGGVLLQVALPLCLAFAILYLTNLFVKPGHISRYLGKGSGVKGLALSTVVGILSMGPIYAWYPLLKDLREKGASDFHVANFLASRAVKPFLLPVMVSYFGWVFTATLTVLTLVGGIIIALLVSALAARSPLSKKQG